MAPTSIEAKSLLRGHGWTDPWFVGTWGMNMYRGCAHACSYCDGRAEKYGVQGDFAASIAVKRNALELLRQELGRQREPGILFVGGGVSDSYQPLEAAEGLTRRALELALELERPVHVLTKSVLVERDFDLLEKLARGPGAVLSFSIQTVDESVRSHFEPGAAPVHQRFDLLARARERGIATGIMAMPILPGIGDKAGQILSLLRAGHEAGVEFLCLAGLTLRPGRQRELYLQSVTSYDAALLAGYERLYRARRPSGAPESSYLDRVTQRYANALRSCPLPGRMPHALFRGKLPLYSELAVLAEHEAFRLRLERPHDSIARELEKASRDLQLWCKARRTRSSRKRGWSYRALEEELVELLSNGELSRALGWSAELDTAVRSLLERCAMVAPQQRSLL
ncbi:MAG: radical SAM protein [Polyangiaceae bacterium]|nr:radical SAM protein [Polyangiaceae bacterium]